MTTIEQVKEQMQLMQQQNDERMQKFQQAIELMETQRNDERMHMQQQINKAEARAEAAEQAASAQKTKFPDTPSRDFLAEDIAKFNTAQKLAIKANKVKQLKLQKSRRSTVSIGTALGSLDFGSENSTENSTSSDHEHEHHVIDVNNQRAEDVVDRKDKQLTTKISKLSGKREDHADEMENLKSVFEQAGMPHIVHENDVFWSDLHHSDSKLYQIQERVMLLTLQRICKEGAPGTRFRTAKVKDSNNCRKMYTDVRDAYHLATNKATVRRFKRELSEVKWDDSQDYDEFVLTITRLCNQFNGLVEATTRRSLKYTGAMRRDVIIDKLIESEKDLPLKDQYWEDKLDMTQISSSADCDVLDELHDVVRPRMEKIQQSGKTGKVQQQIQTPEMQAPTPPTPAAKPPSSNIPRHERQCTNPACLLKPHKGVGHTIDTCFLIHGVPENLKRRSHMKQNNRFGNGQRIAQGNGKLICYGCGQEGHIRRECPNQNRSGQSNQQLQYPHPPFGTDHNHVQQMMQQQWQQQQQQQNFTQQGNNWGQQGMSQQQAASGFPTQPTGTNNAPWHGGHTGVPTNWMEGVPPIQSGRGAAQVGTFEGLTDANPFSALDEDYLSTDAMQNRAQSDCEGDGWSDYMHPRSDSGSEGWDSDPPQWVLDSAILEMGKSDKKTTKKKKKNKKNKKTKREKITTDSRVTSSGCSEDSECICKGGATLPEAHNPLWMSNDVYTPDNHIEVTQQQRERILEEFLCGGNNAGGGAAPNEDVEESITNEDEEDGSQSEADSGSAVTTKSPSLATN